MSKKTVHSTLTQLTSAYKAHYKLYKTASPPEPSHLLLLFYAVECGLKAYYLQENRLLSTEDFESPTMNKYGYGHKLAEWVQEVRMPASAISFVDDPNDPIENMHEKLRYGVSLSHLTQKKQVDFLQQVINQLKGKL